MSAEPSKKHKKDPTQRDARPIVWMIAFLVVAMIVVTGLGILLAWVLGSVLGWFPHEARVHDQMTDYMQIRLTSAAAIVGTEALGNWFGGFGNTKMQMRAGVLTMVANIGLNWLLIEGHAGAPAMGVAGAAWATVISQVLAVIWLLSYYTGGRSAVALRRRCLRPSLPVLIESAKVGSSAFVRQVGIALSWGVLNKIFAGTGGDIAVASSGVVQRMLAIVVMPIIGMGQGLLPIVGYNYGARHYDRVIDVMRKSNYISTIFCAVSALILFAFPGEILGFFSDDPNMLAMGVPGARLAALGMVTIGSQVMISTFYQGTGQG